MAMKIGEYLVSIKVLTAEQVSDVLQAQKTGDKRKFGEIAVAKGYMEDSSIMRFTDFLSEHQEFNS
jgi:hypothetical protein